MCIDWFVLFIFLPLTFCVFVPQRLCYGHLHAGKLCQKAHKALPEMTLKITPHSLVSPIVAPALTTKSRLRSRFAMGWRDDWPSMPDGKPYDGTNLLQLALDGKSPFSGVWDVRLLIREIEEHLNTKVADIPLVSKGSNNYGFHIKTSDQRDLVARLARSDVNMPDFDGLPIETQAPEARFEAAVYDLLRPELLVRCSHLLYSRVPVQHLGPKLTIPQDLLGRRLFVFEKSEGVDNVWRDLSAGHKQFLLLEQLASVRAALFRYNPPLEFAAEYFLKRLFKFMPASLAVPVALTREFWMHVLEAKIEATVRGEGEMIGWEDDNETVGPAALAAKQSILRAIPYFLPVDDSSEGSLYRCVIEHGDFGIHNATITTQGGGDEPLVTSVFDWETACVWPALLSDPLVAVSPVDLVVDEDGGPSVTRLPAEATQADLQTYTGWANHYIEKLCQEAPGYEAAIRKGKDFRKLWFALRDWRGGNTEEFFGALGAWAEMRTRELGGS